MQHEEFNAVLEHMIANVYSTLGSKGDEYATEDRLHNFKQSASMAQCTQMQALGGMMVKHTTSIYDMIRDSALGKTFSPEKWDEKITDHLNYLILLKAVAVEEANSRTEEAHEQLPLFATSATLGDDDCCNANVFFSAAGDRAQAIENFREAIKSGHITVINPHFEQGERHA